MDQSYKDTKKRLFKKKYATSKALQAQKSFLKVQHTKQETNECKYNRSLYLVTLETRYNQLSAKALAKIVRYNEV